MKANEIYGNDANGEDSDHYLTEDGGPFHVFIFGKSITFPSASTTFRCPAKYQYPRAKVSSSLNRMYHLAIGTQN
jgi:hypothetical protein